MNFNHVHGCYVSFNDIQWLLIKVTGRETVSTKPWSNQRKYANSDNTYAEKSFITPTQGALSKTLFKITGNMPIATILMLKKVL